jgi:hypothetical protein
MFWPFGFGALQRGGGKRPEPDPCSAAADFEASAALVP